MKPLRSLIILSIMFVLVTQYTNCSTYSDNSLLQGTPSLTNLDSLSPDEGFLEPPGLAIDVKNSENIMQFAGNCSFGTNETHYLEFKVMTLDSGSAMAVSPDTICVGGNISSSECMRYTQSKCEHGRYYAAIPISQAFRASTNAQQFYLQGQLVTIDSSGNEARNDRASFEGFLITIRK